MNTSQSANFLATQTTLIVTLGRNIRLRKKSYTLADGISIRTFTQSEIEPIVKTLSYGLNFSDIQHILQSDTLLHLTFAAPKLEAKHTGTVHEIDERIWNEFDKILDEKFHMIKHMLMALIFTKPIDLLVKPVLIFQRSMNKLSGGTVRHLSFHWPKGAPSEILTETDLPLAVELYQRINSLSTDTKKGAPSKLARSINFFWQAQATQYFVPAFILYVTSLEALLLTGIAELKHKLAERAALLIVDKPEDKFDIDRKISKAYDTRSILVHGGKHRLTTQQLNSLMFETANITRKSIRKTLLDDNLMNILGRSSKRESEKVENFFKYLTYGYEFAEAIAMIITYDSKSRVS